MTVVVWFYCTTCTNPKNCNKKIHCMCIFKIDQMHLLVNFIKTRHCSRYFLGICYQLKLCLFPVLSKPNGNLQDKTSRQKSTVDVCISL